MVGSAIDLAKKHHVLLTDVDPSALEKAKEKCKSSIHCSGCNDVKTMTETITNFDLVVSAVPGFLGYQTLENIINAEMNVVDISFFPENSLDLNKLAIEKGVTAIVDCGVAPGMDNVILGYYNETHKLTDFECLVGGLPKVKKWPFCYKAPFSPSM